MGRPSIQEKRFEEILDAFEICVANYGLAGATLEKIAEQAGLARPLIRHHLGNRDDLIKALINRFINHSDQYLRQLVADLPDTGCMTEFINRLFDHRYHDRHYVLTMEALIAAAANQPDLADKINLIIESIITVIEKQISLEYPEAKINDVKIVASGILGIYFNIDSLSLLGDINELRLNSRSAAARLVDTLRQ